MHDSASANRKSALPIMRLQLGWTRAMRHIGLLFLAAMALGAAAQDHPADPTSEQILEYKVKTAADCTVDATHGGLDSSQARSFCSCTTDFVWQAMPPAELREAYVNSVRGSKTEELTLLRPYIRKAVRECNASLKP